MDYSITFARHFSRLVWLLLNERGNVEEQKAALRAVVTTSRDGAITLATQEYRLVVNGSLLPDALTGVQDLAAQLIGHAIGDVQIRQNAVAADLIVFARILASEPIPGDGGRTVLQKLHSAGVSTLMVTVRTSGPIAADPPPPPGVKARPSGAMDAIPSSPTNGASPREHTSASRREHRSAPLAHQRAAPLPHERTAPAPRVERTSASLRSSRASGSTRKERTSASARREATSAPLRPFGDAGTQAPPGGVGTMNATPGIVGEESGRYLAFAAVQAPRGSADESFAKLDAANSVAIVTRLLDELVQLVENAGRDARADIVADVMAGMVTREAATNKADRKRAFTMALRRLSKPTLLRLVAQLLPRRREKAEVYLAVLAHAGEDGADALIEQLTAAQSLSDRRLYFDGLLALQAGISALVHMLGDARWYVVRNAADLLGELQAKEAEIPLTDAVRHDDDRVRRAAAAALAKLGTPRSHQALREALRDTSAQVRMQAAIGLSQHKQARQGVTLSRALDAEADEEVQLAILASLGRIATAEAVQKLIAAAEAEGRIFRKKSAAYRLAAVQALGDAGTPEAVAALKGLAEDKDKDVRELVGRLVEGK